jgi:hypothetical protein
MKVLMTLNASRHRMPLAGIVTGNRDQAPICSTPHGSASLGFVTSRHTGYPRGQPKHSVDPGRHDVPNASLTWPTHQRKAYEPSLNFEPGCIKVVDTFRTILAAKHGPFRA